MTSGPDSLNFLILGVGCYKFSLIKTGGQHNTVLQHCRFSSEGVAILFDTLEQTI